MKAPRIAVLGAGIMGSSVALFLARKGARVTLIDLAAEPFSGASRWNEGKIHLGYLYSRDSSNETCRRILPGGLAFRQIAEELTGHTLVDRVTPEDETYLVHRGSIVGSDRMARQFEAVTEQVRAQAGPRDYFADLSKSKVHRLSQRELEQIADTRAIVAGFRVPERSVRTNWLADRFVEALHTEPRVHLAMKTRVKRVRPADTSAAGHWRVETDPATESPFEFVVNALWHGRLAVDRSVGLEPEPGWSHRYRLSLFVQTGRPVDVPSAVVATGPFGDVKNYSGSDFYLSWYPAGLMAEGHEIDPPIVPDLSDDGLHRIGSSTIRGLSEAIPSVRAIAEAALSEEIKGGWIYALGRGSLSDSSATVHRRSGFGVRRIGSYLSVDTGKFSTAPWLARQVAESILGA